MPIQIRNSESVDLQSADFQLRYEPNFAHKSVASVFLALPGVRGVWCAGNFDELGNVHDLTGQGRTVAYNGNPTFNYDDLAPYIDLDGTGDYLDRADEAGLDILGNEAYVAVAAQGVTLGGWFWVDTVDGLTQYLVAKGNNALGNTNYLIACPAGTTTPQFAVSNGVTFNALSSSVAMGLTTWAFVVARYEAATPRCDVWVNDTQTADLAGIPAAPLVNTAVAFTIGASPGPSFYLDGRMSICFLCAAALSDAQIFSAFHQTRAMYGA